MRQSLLDPRPAALMTATVVAVISWFATDLGGASRAFTTLLAFAAAFLAFNAASAYFES